MNRWLLKADPDDYGYDQLERDRKAVWDGIRNNQALNYLREMVKGDRALIYHTGGEKQVVGLAEILRGPYPDPKAGDEKLVVVDLKPVKRLPSPVTLARIKSDPRLAQFALVRQSRLSVMPVPEATWDVLCDWAGIS